MRLCNLALEVTELTGDRQLDWEDIKALHGVSRGGSFAAAAKLLGLSHATVGRRIARLETELGEKLVNRVAGGARLTVLGEELAKSAASMAAEADAIGRLALSGRDSVKGRVTIAAPPGLTIGFVVPACKMIARRYSEITLRVSGAMDPVSLDSLEADLAIRMVKPENPSHSRRLLGSLEYGVFARGENSAEIETLPWVGLSDRIKGLPEREILNDLAGDKGVSYEFDDILGQLAAIKNGLGRGVLPKYIGEENSELVCVWDNRTVLRRDIWLAQHLDVRNSSAVRAVAETLAEFFMSDRRLGSGGSR